MALAAFKTQRGWEGITLDVIEPHLEQEAFQRRTALALAASASSHPSSSSSSSSKGYDVRAPAMVTSYSLPGNGQRKEMNEMGPPTTTASGKRTRNVRRSSGGSQRDDGSASINGSGTARMDQFNQIPTDNDGQTSFHGDSSYAHVDGESSLRRNGAVKAEESSTIDHHQVAGAYTNLSPPSAAAPPYSPSSYPHQTTSPSTMDVLYPAHTLSTELETEIRREQQSQQPPRTKRRLSLATELRSPRSRSSLALPLMSASAPRASGSGLPAKLVDPSPITSRTSRHTFLSDAATLGEETREGGTNSGGRSAKNAADTLTGLLGAASTLSPTLSPSLLSTSSHSQSSFATMGNQNNTSPSRVLTSNIFRPSTPERNGRVGESSGDGGAAEAELMLFLAASPSPAQVPRTSNVLQFNDGEMMKGRRLFSTGSGTGASAVENGRGEEEEKIMMFATKKNSSVKMEALGGGWPSSSASTMHHLSSSATLLPSSSISATTNNPFATKNSNQNVQDKPPHHLDPLKAPTTPSRDRSISAGGPRERSYSSNWNEFLNHSPEPAVPIEMI